MLRCVSELGSSSAWLRSPTLASNPSRWCTCLPPGTLIVHSVSRLLYTLTLAEELWTNVRNVESDWPPVRDLRPPWSSFGNAPLILTHYPHCACFMRPICGGDLGHFRPATYVPSHSTAGRCMHEYNRIAPRCSSRYRIHPLCRTWISPG